MNIESGSRGTVPMRRLALAAGLAAAIALPVQAEPVSGPFAASRNVVQRAPHQVPLPPNLEGRDEVFIMMCRRGLHGTPLSQPQVQPPQQQELPLLCLVTEADDEALRMGPARFNELLDKAAGSGRMFVLVLHPE